MKQMFSLKNRQTSSIGPRSALLYDVTPWILACSAMLGLYVGLTYLIGSAGQGSDMYGQGIHGLGARPIITTAFMLITPLLMARSRTIFPLAVAIVVVIALPHPPIGYTIAATLPAIALSHMAVFVALFSARRIYEGVRINLARFDDVRVHASALALYITLCAATIAFYINLGWW